MTLRLNMTEETLLTHTIIPLVSNTHCILFKPAIRFDFDNPPLPPVYLANCLIATMNRNSGMGLSANQIGLPWRVFVMRAEEAIVCYNPRIIEVSLEQINLDEGCLSYPFMYIKIKRPISVKARFTNAFGETFTKQFVGMTARCFLHEMDHLEGVNFTQRANKALLDRAKRQVLKVQKRQIPAKLAL
jgi:peptide deformylase